MNKAQLEKKYGITIRDDSFIHPLNGRTYKQYRIYSADGCCWEKGLKGLKGVEKECKEWEKQLLSIKAKVQAI